MANATKSGTPNQTAAEPSFFIPLKDIYVDYDWNGRSKRNVMANESDAVQDTTLKAEHQTLGMGLKGLRGTLRMRGQDTPVILRKVEGGRTLGGKKTDKPLELIAGFRRFTAVEGLNTTLTEEEQTMLKLSGQKSLVLDVPDGHIRAVIRQMTPVEARLTNGRENTDRQNLTTQDMLKLVTDLMAEKLTQDQIATELGVTQGYISKLAKIAKLPKPILAHWRDGTKLPGLPTQTVLPAMRTTDLLELQEMAAKSDPPLTEGQVIKRYIDMLVPPEGESNEPEKDTVADRVKKAAFLCGTLVKLGILENGNLEWSRVIGPKADGYFIDTGKIDAAARLKYWDLAQSTFEAALKDKPKNGAEAGEEMAENNKRAVTEARERGEVAGK